MRNYRHFKYPNLLLFFFMLFLAIYLFRAGILENLVNSLIAFRYLGAFFAGLFFVSTFTVVLATALLFLFAENLNPVLVALAAGLGAVLGDFLIFRFIKDHIVSELKEIFGKIAGDNILNVHWIAHSKYFIWLSPVIGALIIASPFPDELGIGLLGIYKLDSKRFLALSWVLNTVGILVLLGGLRLILD